MTPHELLKYELPAITEYISWDWLQSLIARYYAYKVNRKYYRYEKRLYREKWLREQGLIK